MIVEYQEIQLFNKTVFVKAKIKAPYSDAYAMPDNACFLHVPKGKVAIFTADHEKVISDRQSLLLQCGHYPTHFNSLQKNELTEIILVHFHADVLKKVYEDKLPPYLESSEESPAYSSVSVGASELIDKYMDGIGSYFEHPHLRNTDILVVKIKELILLLLQTDHSDKMRVVLKNLFNQRSVGFRQVIENHIFSELSIAELAVLSNFSLSAFKRHFKEQFDSTPAKYILAKRLERAKHLLEFSGLSVTEICHETGFNNHSHFSKTFKQAYGFSPSSVKRAK